jgi:hypothetical protein
MTLSQHSVCDLERTKPRMENIEGHDAVSKQSSVSADQGTLQWTDVRLPLLLIALCICGFVFLRLLPSDPLLYRAFARVLGQKSEKSPEEMLLSLRMKDPPLGAVLPLPDSDAIKTRPPSRMRISAQHVQVTSWFLWRVPARPVYCSIYAAWIPGARSIQRFA